MKKMLIACLLVAGLGVASANADVVVVDKQKTEAAQKEAKKRAEIYKKYEKALAKQKKAENDAEKAKQKAEQAKKDIEKAQKKAEDARKNYEKKVEEARKAIQDANDAKRAVDEIERNTTIINNYQQTK